MSERDERDERGEGSEGGDWQEEEHTAAWDVAGDDALNGHVHADDATLIGRALEQEGHPDEEALENDIEVAGDGAAPDTTGGASVGAVGAVGGTDRAEADHTAREYSEYADLSDMQEIRWWRELEEKTSWDTHSYEEREEDKWDDAGDTTHRFYKPQTTPRYPPSFLIQEAAHGVVGEIVGAVAAQSEADPAAVLVQFLAAFGRYVGRRAYFPTERDRHYPNLFAVLVGETSKGRKGTSWGQAIRVFEDLSPATDEWLANCTTSGLSSGEGLIHALRDRFAAAGGEDGAVADRRLLVRESEFASVLKMFQREGNTLSAVLRQAWDGETLKVITKHSAEKASGAHIFVIGHITREELTRNLSQTEVANGLGNRFLWLCVRRSKLLPEGGDEARVDFSGARAWLRPVICWIETLHDAPLRRDEEAAEMWRRVYAALSAGEPGLAGALLARAEAQVMRLASIFGAASGDTLADTILGALRLVSDGLTRTQIGSLFGKHISGARITETLNTLAARGKVTSFLASTGRRPAEIWQALDELGNTPEGRSW